MRVLVLGSGAKDHAILSWFAKSSCLTSLYCAPGNIATADIATNLPDVDPANAKRVYEACLQYNIEFVFIGTEAPLYTGVIDFLIAQGIETFGAPVHSLKLEGDRNFARAFTDRHNIATPRRNLFDNLEELTRFLRRHEGETFVLKSNTITPSRIMLDSSNTEALINFADALFKRGPVLLEEHIDGLSITCTLLLDNAGYLMLPLTSDYMHSSANDKTPTGGMGSICPVPLTPYTTRHIIDNIIEPTLYGMKVEQLSYKGVLTLSLIINDKREPILVDYHVRFNDPATQAIIPLIKTDIHEIIECLKKDELSKLTLECTDESTVAVVIASEGYPLFPQTGKEISHIPALLFHNIVSQLPQIFTGAVQFQDGKPVTTGGRCFTVVGKGENIQKANKSAYDVVKLITFPGAWYREDIGNKFFEKSALSAQPF